MRLFQRASGTYYVQISRTVKRSLKTKDPAVAERIFQELKHKQAAGKLAKLSAGDAISIGQFLNEFKSFGVRKLSRRNFDMSVLAVRRLLEVIPARTPLPHLTHKHLDLLVTKALQGRLGKQSGTPLKPTTINNYIRHLKSTIAYAVSWQYLSSNPFQGYKEIAVEETPPSFLPGRDDINRLLQNMSDKGDLTCWYWAMGLLCTGRRISELVNLSWDWVDFQRQSYFVRKTKNKHSKWYPMHPAFLALLEMLPRDREWVFPKWRSRNTVYKHVKEALVEIGFPDLTMHDLRHTFASHAVMSGLNLKVVQRLLGHRSQKTTEMYAHLAPDYLEEQVKNVYSRENT